MYWVLGTYVHAFKRTVCTVHTVRYILYLLYIMYILYILHILYILAHMCFNKYLSEMRTLHKHGITNST